MIQYGLISETDARCLEKTIDLICDQFKDGHIRVTEIGIFNGDTGKGIKEYVLSKMRNIIITGIDSEKDKPIPDDVKYDCIVEGNSTEKYHTVQDNSQHLCFVDGDHSFIGVISDFFAYAPKIMVGGYFAFHDTGKHIKAFKDFQHGDKTNPDAYISVRKALRRLGLIDTKYIALEADGTYLEDWELIFDEADTSDEAGGICVFKKIN